MLEIIIIIISIFYIIQISLFAFGTIKTKRLKTFPKEPSISLIIAARNEENNIGSCLESLLNLNYPKDKLEIIIVNDHSTDKTSEIISQYIEKNPLIKTFIPAPPKDHLKGKANAISQAIMISKGEFVFTTDADCILPPDWLLNTIKYYGDDTGLVSGFTYLEYNSVFQGFQSLDWVYLLTVASGSFGIGIPLSCVGNNMSFRRKTYDEVGGYCSLPFSVTEDFALLQAIAKTKKWKCEFPFEKNNIVFSKACTSFKQLVFQKKRWGTGGKKSPFLGLVLMISGWLISGLLLVLPFLNVTLSIAFIPIIVKVLLDFLFLLIPLRFFNLLKICKYFPVFEIYYTFYVFALPFLVFINPKVRWKGRVYSG
jgi:cellulose synthase/poly-beta-1,6-N-acetylglucosamine synthase-like glycosyltransferase